MSKILNQERFNTWTIWYQTKKFDISITPNHPMVGIEFTLNGFEDMVEDCYLAQTVKEMMKSNSEFKRLFEEYKLIEVLKS